jgi:hypothetical protein
MQSFQNVVYEAQRNSVKMDGENTMRIVSNFNIPRAFFSLLTPQSVKIFHGLYVKVAKCHDMSDVACMHARTRTHKVYGPMVNEWNTNTGVIQAHNITT